MKEHGIGSGQIIRRKEDGSFEYHRDDLTIEEPLEIRARREGREKHALRISQFRAANARPEGLTI